MFRFATTNEQRIGGRPSHPAEGERDHDLCTTASWIPIADEDPAETTCRSETALEEAARRLPGLAKKGVRLKRVLHRELALMHYRAECAARPGRPLLVRHLSRSKRIERGMMREFRRVISTVNRTPQRYLLRTYDAG